MFGDLADLDFSGLLDDMPDADWAALLADMDFGDFGGDLLFDTDTGQFVDAATVNPADIVDMDFGDLPVGNVPGGPTGTSLSDQLRSQTADPSAQIIPKSTDGL